MEKVVGKQITDFVNSDGNQIKGVRLHVNSDEDNVEGLAAFSQFVDFYKKPKLYELSIALPIGSEVKLVYDRKNKLDDIIVYEKGKSESK